MSYIRDPVPRVGVEGFSIFTRDILYVEGCTGVQARTMVPCRDFSLGPLDQTTEYGYTTNIEPRQGWY